MGNQPSDITKNTPSNDADFDLPPPRENNDTSGEAGDRIVEVFEELTERVRRLRGEAEGLLGLLESIEDDVLSISADGLARDELEERLRVLEAERDVLASQLGKVRRDADEELGVAREQIRALESELSSGRRTVPEEKDERARNKPLDVLETPIVETVGPRARREQLKSRTTRPRRDRRKEPTAPPADKLPAEDSWSETDFAGLLDDDDDEGGGSTNVGTFDELLAGGPELQGSVEDEPAAEEAPADTGEEDEAFDLELPAPDHDAPLELDLPEPDDGDSFDLDLPNQDGGGDLELDLPDAEDGDSFDLDLPAADEDARLELELPDVEDDAPLKLDIPPPDQFATPVISHAETEEEEFDLELPPMDSMQAEPESEAPEEEDPLAVADLLSDYLQDEK